MNQSNSVVATEIKRQDTKKIANTSMHVEPKNGNAKDNDDDDDNDDNHNSNNGNNSRNNDSNKTATKQQHQQT